LSSSYIKNQSPETYLITINHYHKKTDKDLTLRSKVANLKPIYLATSIPAGVRVQVEFFWFLAPKFPKTVLISSKRNMFGTKGRTGLDFMVLVLAVSWFCFTAISVSATTQADPPSPQPNQKLRFGQNGEFKILQVADMHYANGKTTPCLNVLPSQNLSCSDLNTTLFINRMIQAEKPNLIVFTGN